MSLFGDDDSVPSAPVSKSRLSLFDDEPSPTPGSKSSLFADDDSAPGSSPWGLPTPKKAARGDVIKNLLPASEVPDSYIDTFDDIIKAGDGLGGKISAAGATKILSSAKLGADEQSRIVSIVSSGGQLSDLSRNEFNVFLALIGLAQEHEDITLDSVDERRRSQCIFWTETCKTNANKAADLPVPKLPSLSRSAFAGVSELAAKPPQRPITPPPAPASVSPAKPRTMRKDSLEFPEADPWGSPAMHRGHNHESSPPKTNGTSRAPTNGIREPVRTTSTFTTASTEASNGAPSQPSESAASPPAAGVWGSYDGDSSAPFPNPGESAGGGFGDGGGDRPTPNLPVRSFGGGQVTVGGVEEIVTVTLLPEKEGMFMFQHHNYQVSSPRRGSKVVRRYSDFVWLLDCLQKRYPFRQLPLLPPKRVGGMDSGHFD